MSSEYKDLQEQLEKLCLYAQEHEEELKKDPSLVDELYKEIINLLLAIAIGKRK